MTNPPEKQKKSAFDQDRLKNADVTLRIAGAVLFLILTAARFYTLESYGSPYLRQNHPGIFYAYRLLWGAETLVFLIYAGAYLFRKPAVRLASGFKEAVFPFIAAATPFLIIRHGFMARIFPGYDRPYQDLTRLEWGGRQMYIVQVNISPIPLAAAVAVMLIGTVIMIAAMVHLWRSFSIMAEARELVTSGLYRYIRHPLYTGEFIAYLGVLALRFTVLNVIIYLGFVICQYIRARVEEEKLASVFPGYMDYSSKTGMFLPNIHLKMLNM